MKKNTFYIVTPYTLVYLRVYEKSFVGEYPYYSSDICFPTSFKKC